MILDNDVARALGIIDDADAVDIFLLDVVGVENVIAEPIDQSAPVLFAEKDHREIRNLFRLN